MFLGSLSLPLLGTRLRPASEQQVAEGRQLAVFPELALSSEAINSFPAAFEAFFTDRLGFRQRFIQLVALIKVKVLGVSPDDRVLIGKNDWLFLAAWPPGADSVIQQHRGIRLFTKAELERWKTALETRRDWLAGRGIRYLFVLAPDKHSIYPEFLPDHVSRVRNTTPADQLVAYMKAHSDVPFLDLRPPILAAKKRGELYWRNDTHWNQWGAYVAHREIIRVLSGWFPVLRTPAEADVEVTFTEGRYGGDLARAMHLSRLYYEVGPTLIPQRQAKAQRVEPELPPLPPDTAPPIDLLATHTPFKFLPRGVMLHDSFGDTLVSFLSEYFDRMVYLNRPATRDFIEGHRTHPFFNALVEAEKPDILIDQVVERNLIWSYKDFE